MARVGGAPSFFSGLTEDELGRVLRGLSRRRVAEGAVVLEEGKSPTEMLVILSGIVAVLVRDDHGEDSRVGELGPGDTIGETALFTGPASEVNRAAATLRALTDVAVVAVEGAAFPQLAAAYPQVLHNLGAILSHRLTRSYQRAARAERGRITALRLSGGPPLLAWALAGSVAWHSRAATVLAVIGPTNGELTALAGHGRLPEEPGAGLVLLSPAASPPALAAELDELSDSYRHVLVLLPPGGTGDDPTRHGVWASMRRIALADARQPLLVDSPGGDRPGHAVRGWVSAAPARGGPGRDGVVSVPALTAADEAALRRGLLPAATPAGAALGWLARDLCGLKVGLALGAGSVRGYAHYGVLRVFERVGLKADYVCGTSIGAIIASTYALGHGADEAARVMESTSMRAFRLTAPIHSLLSNAGVAENFRSVSGERRIEDLDMPLALVAADLTTGREVVFRRGLLRVAALASMAIPGIYPPVRIGESVLVDGGVVNPVPTSVACSMGADVVIAASLSRPSGAPAPDVEAVEGNGRPPSLLHTIVRSVEVMQGRIGMSATAAATVLLEMDFAEIPGLGLHAFSEGRPYIAPGEAAAEAALPALSAALPWLRG